MHRRKEHCETSDCSNCKRDNAHEAHESWIRTSFDPLRGLLVCGNRTRTGDSPRRHNAAEPESRRMRCRRVGLSACPTKPWRSRACRRLRSSSKAKSYSYSHVSPGVATTLRLRLGVGMILGNLNWPQTERPNGMRPSNVLCCVWFAPP